MEQIQLNLINKSNDTNHSEYVIFQKNVNPNFSELSVAWRVVKNLGRDDYHPFSYSLKMEVSAGDSYGNFTPKLDAYPGQKFKVSLTGSGDRLTLDGADNSPTDIQVVNDLAQGAISANIYRDGKLLAKKTSIAPREFADFEFKPTIFIGAAAQIQEGVVINSAILSTNTELSLLGIASADIVITGGGPGPTSQPFEFSLQNVVFA